MNRIAIVGMGCEYPDAADPGRLWENAVGGRRSFRRIPDGRMSLDDYHDADPTAPDKFYADHAAVLEGYEFDRLAYRIPGSTFRSTDLTHWLALDVAARALADAGFEAGRGLPHERTGVVVGNTLTGEFSRANVMRLRWPYVRRVLVAELREAGWEDAAVVDLVDSMERRYKAPFPELDEDSLAGSLANTIAGRICNYFDLHGGGFTVDGACSSSLLAVTTAARALLVGDLDVVVAGGVDLSIDPFEMVGFAKTGALARTEMKLYDAGSNGFWPGEGCGMVVLMREEDALASGRTPLAYVAGWGVSSDGAGGMARPELAGYQLALRRAYDQAGFSIDTVPYFEGHGTGTPVGDDLELSAISGARRAAGATDRAAIGSIKAQVGHTKAAAGIAGLIKAVQAVRHGVLPPTIGCITPHPRFEDEDATVRPVPVAEPWPAGKPLRAGVTSMGFGGINTHVVVEGAPAGACLTDWEQDPEVRALAAARQDVEALLFSAGTVAELADRLRAAAGVVRRASYAELTDLAVAWTRAARHGVRAAVVATSPQDAARRLTVLADHLTEHGVTAVVTEVVDGGYLGIADGRPPARIGLLFPGQGTGSHHRGGALARRLPSVAAIYAGAPCDALADPVATQNAQPLTVTGSLAALEALRTLGIRASVATGHSLGELCALTWAGALDAAQVVELARVRGTAMAEHGRSGTMATLDADAGRVRDLLSACSDEEVTLGALNSPRHTVVSGTSEAVTRVLAAAEAQGVAGRHLPVSHAFHSPLVRPAGEVLRAYLTQVPLRSLEAGAESVVISTVTGDALGEERGCTAAELVDLLVRQVVEPVDFAGAVAAAAARCDLLVEAGPGRSMAHLAVANGVAVPVVSLDTDDAVLTSFLTVAAAAWVGGALPDPAVLVDGRFHRPPPSGNQVFLRNPAEDVAADGLSFRRTATESAAGVPGRAAADVEDVLDLLVSVAAERAELPVEVVGPASRMLDDLHLSSITVGQVVARVADTIGVVADFSSLNLATSTVGELAAGLEKLRRGAQAPPSGDPLGAVGTFVGTWAERFEAVPQRKPWSGPSGVPGEWTALGTWSGAIAPEAVAAALEATGRSGLVVGIAGEPDRDALREHFDTVRAATTLGAGRQLVVVGGNDTTTALAKTFFLEHPEVHVTVVDGDGSAGPDEVAREVAATDGFGHVRYLDGVRHEPTLVAVDTVAPVALHPRRTDGARPVLIATGGAKGITAECALAWARRLGAATALVGRSAATAPDVVATLRRFEESGLDARYLQADLASPGQVSAVVEQARGALGPVTHLLHGAGRNEPATLDDLDWDDVEHTFAPKVDALAALLEALGDPLGEGDTGLRHVVTFGSLIGRAGLWGDAHYAMANAEMAGLTRRFGQTHPGCRTTCVEWSVWSEVGMGARLGAAETLGSAGITAIRPDDGVDLFLRLTDDATAGLPSEVVVCGRLDSIPTLRVRAAELPLGRFLDRVRRHHPGYELVVDAVLSAATDPYLVDHEIDGERVLPAVLGLEAMAQVVAALTGVRGAPRFRDVRLDRPVVVPEGEELVVRLAATRRVDGSVDVALLSEASSFAVPHFSAVVDPDLSIPAQAGTDRLAEPPTTHPTLDAATELYGDLLFQRGRFERVLGYDALGSTHIAAWVTETDAPWFAGGLPTELVLGDPGVRDALMHGNQVSVPDATLLPQRIDVLEVLRVDVVGNRRFVARETHHEGSLHVYDIDVTDADGELVERWRGLHLRALRQRPPAAWPLALLGPYLERAIGDTGARACVTVEPGDGTGSPSVSASVDGARCAVRVCVEDAAEVTRDALAEALSPDGPDGLSAEPRELGLTRGLRRVGAGPAQALTARVTTTRGDTLSIAVAWSPQGVAALQEAVA